MTFVSELHAALAKPHQAEAAQAVHELVARAIERLDRGVEVKRTDYSTHSFVPDLVVRWGPSEQRRERHVHLRFSVIGRSFEQDLDLLGEDAPLFLGMTDSADLSHPAWDGARHRDGRLARRPKPSDRRARQRDSQRISKPQRNESAGSLRSRSARRARRREDH